MWKKSQISLVFETKSAIKNNYYLVSMIEINYSVIWIR